jgi:cold shock protein
VPVSPKPTKGLTNVPTGILKVFNADRGFGFIKLDEGGNDVFVHVSAAERSGVHSLQEGMRLGRS